MSRVCERLVYVKTARMKNLTREDQEEVIQDIMLKITKYLPSFRFDLRLRRGCI